MEDRFARSNAPKIYQVQKDLSTLVQGSLSIANYFTQLKTLWDEYLAMIDLPTCNCGTGSGYMKLLQTQQVMQFLVGLNDTFKTARGNILMMNPIPNLNQVYRLILQEEKQRDCHNIISDNMNYDATTFTSFQKNQYLKNQQDRFGQPTGNVFESTKGNVG